MAEEKWLYEFKINKEVAEKQKEETTNEKGEKVTVEKDVVSKKPIYFALRQPKRKDYDDADLFYSVKLSEGIKAGLLTRPLLERRYENDGGIFNEDDKDRYGELYKNIFEKENELQKVALNLEEKDSEEKREELASVYADLSLLRRELQEYEIRYTSLFDQTAENRAKNQTIMWWTLNLSHQKEDENKDYKPVFDGESYERKLDSYDARDDTSDLFWDEALKKLIYFTSFWHSGQGDSKEDFKNAESFFNSGSGYTEEEEVAEEVAEEVVEEVVEKVVEETPEEVAKETVENEPKKPTKKRGKTKKVEEKAEPVSE